MKLAESLSQFTGSLDGFQGFSRVSRACTALWEARVAQAASLWAAVIRDREPLWMLREAFSPSSDVAFEALCRRYPLVFRETMTTSDFAALTADVLDRQLLANYELMSVDWRQLVKVTAVNDFRAVKRYGVNGGEGLFQKTPELVTHERQPIAEATLVTYAPYLYQSGAALSWQAIMNDDLGIFRDLPQRLATGANSTIQKFVTELYVDANGPHASLFTGGNANIINTANGAGSNNPALSITGLQDAITVLMGQKTPVDSIPITVQGIILVVPERLYVTAQNIKNQLLVDIVERGGTANQVLRVGNWLAPQFSIVVNPWIPVVASSSNTHTSWFVFSDPNRGRPVLEVGFLRGFSEPQLFRKAPNTERLAGGIDPMLGDFDTMATEYKCAIVFGGARVDGKGAVASNGSGA